jgi:hypothetical protein
MYIKDIIRVKKPIQRLGRGCYDWVGQVEDIKMKALQAAEVCDVFSWGCDAIVEFKDKLYKVMLRNDEVEVIHSNPIRKRKFWPLRTHEKQEI